MKELVNLTLSLSHCKRVIPDGDYSPKLTECSIRRLPMQQLHIMPYNDILKAYIWGDKSTIICYSLYKAVLRILKLTLKACKISFNALNYISLNCGAVVQWLSLLYNFIQISLNSGSARVQTLLAACRRFAMVRISDSGLGWK